MSPNFKHVARTGVNYILRMADVELVRKHRPFADYRDYIPFEQTLSEARKAGLSVGDYIEARHNQPGSAQRTIDELTGLGVFDGPIERLCEIGPGSGRYLEKVLRHCTPSSREIYETAPSWRQWLVEQYRVEAHPTDGRTLAHTPNGSIDLVQAHKVMPGQPSLTICGYYEEMARVVRPGGWVVFDIVTERCFDDETLARWQRLGYGYQHYPSLMPRQFTVEFFARRGLECVGSFVVPMEPGSTECFAFRRPLPAEPRPEGRL
jgi:hypothetical protein